LQEEVLARTVFQRHLEELQAKVTSPEDSVGGVPS
jgi:hypothetical protein